MPKTTLPFCMVCQKLSHCLPEHGAVPGESDNRLMHFLQKRYILLQNWEVCHFGGGNKNATKVAHCKLQDTTSIPPVSIISLFIFVFCNISKMPIVHQAFKEAGIDFSYRFFSFQMQLLSHKTYNASNQFSRQCLSFTLVLEFCGFSSPIQNSLTNFFSFSPGNKI